MSYFGSFFFRDGSVPVSFIQKYLMRKLDLTNEAEVNKSIFDFFLKRPQAKLTGLALIIVATSKS